jgi:hypothetical protein
MWRPGGIYPRPQATTNQRDASSVTEPIPARISRDGQTEPLPARISPDGRTATWNPALTRAAHVLLRVRREADGAAEERRSLNSGRARVREGERIEAVTVVIEESEGG